MDQSILPDNKLIVLALSDAYHFGIVSSSVHVCWAISNSGTLGSYKGDVVYAKSRCFDPFPFPALEEGELKQRIRDLGERLDAHRKRQQEAHPDLTLTGIYNVLEKLRSGETLTAKDKVIHEQGLVSVLKQIHDDLDAAVLEAYGWEDLRSHDIPVVPRSEMSKEEDETAHSSAAPVPLRQECRSSLSDVLALGDPAAEALQQELLTRLVALNHERAAEEKRGLIRYLRPDYQAPGATAPQQSEIGLTGDAAPTTPDAAPAITLAWPAELPAQVAALRKLLPTIGQDPETLAACFGRKSKKRSDQITAILATLKALGHIV